MRGDSNTKRMLARTGLFGAILLVSTVMSCGDGPDLQNGQVPNYPGHAVISWTLNGAPLTADSCKSERITSMNVFVVNKQDRSENVEFENVTCGLDRYSMAMVPEGSLRVFVDAVRDADGSPQCVRYSGQADTVGGSSFSTQATTLILQPVNKCP